MNVNWAGWVTGGIGLILTVFFYIRSRKIKIPRYTLEYNNLFEELPDLVPDLKVEYKGEQVANLTITKVRFWNAGKDTIDADDVVKPIVIEVQGDCRIISAKLLKANQEANKFECSPPTEDGSKVTISFHHLCYNEGGHVQIAHTGTGKESLTLTGRIKEAGDPKQIFYSSQRAPQVPHRPLSRRQRLTFGSVMIIAPLILWGVVLSSWFLEMETTPSRADQVFIGVVTTLLTVFFWLFAYVIFFLQVPDGLE